MGAVMLEKKMYFTMQVYKKKVILGPRASCDDVVTRFYFYLAKHKEEIAAVPPDYTAASLLKL